MVALELTGGGGVVVDRGHWHHCPWELPGTLANRKTGEVAGEDMPLAGSVGDPSRRASEERIPFDPC